MDGGPPVFPRRFLVSRGTLDLARSTLISPTGLSPCLVRLPIRFGYLHGYLQLSKTPRILLPLVWPLAISLATTFAISFDFSSSPYLDVSVQAVPFLHLFDSMQDLWAFPTGVSPFGHPRINAHLQLPVAFRSLSRPSSAPSAKAFPLRSFLLDQSWFSQELLWQPCSARCILYTLCQNRKTFKLSI